MGSKNTQRQRVKDMLIKPIVKKIIVKQSRIESVFVTMTPYLIGFAAFFLIILLTQLNQTSHEVKTTGAYIRVSNCILGKNTGNNTLTQDEIERCYIQVEKSSGITLERFDEQTNNKPVIINN